MSRALDINTLAQDYEDDFRYCIHRVTSGDYESVIDSFFLLTDLFCLIQRLEELEKCYVNIPPPTAIANPTKLEQRLLLEPAEKRKLRDFLTYVERKKGASFEQLVAARMKDCGHNPEMQPIA